MRILFTISEGSFWNPLHLHSIDKQGLLNLLCEDIGDICVVRNRNYTILEGVMVSDTLKLVPSNSIHEKNLKFHSLMFEDGTIFDSYFYYINRDDGLDHKFYQIRDFGLPADRFEELWKNMTEKAHEIWVSKKIKEKIRYSMNKKMKRKHRRIRKRS